MHLLQILVTFVLNLSAADDNQLQPLWGASWKSDLQFLGCKIDQGPPHQQLSDHSY